ncbi:DUF6233 domain-containing protein [Streptomyces sp. NPDC048484]|uniref:DUF6233 domain-containing protein n=1 Tax=Streptomyces sp. NPDC048484 TaxID=3155146 RepID=UPI003420F0FC
MPVRVVLPADPILGHPEQEVVARLWRRRQTETGWLYLVGLPSYRDLEDGSVEAAEYRVWVRAPDHVRPVAGVNYDQVATEHLPPAPTSVVREVLGKRRSSGWVLAKVREGRGPARGVLHAPDCEEAPQGAPLLGVEQALNVAENPGTRLCTLCGCAQELTPMLSGFDHITDSWPSVVRRCPRW